VTKLAIGRSTQLFPMPALLVAVRTGEDTANILTIAWGGIVGGNPPMLALCIYHGHHSAEHINREMSFTVNIPSSNQAPGVDYCGVVSGKDDADKAGSCGWTLAPSNSIASPMIVECPISFECRVVQRLKAGRSTYYLAEILDTHVEESLLAESRRVDGRLLDPLIYCPDGYYYRLGERIAQEYTLASQIRTRD